MGNRTSIFWKISREELVKVVANSNSLSDIVRSFNLVVAGSHYKTLKKRLQEDNIDFSHIKLGLGNNKGRRFCSTAKPLQEIMIKNSNYNRGNLKKRLLSGNILENRCYICCQKEIWNGKKLIMVLDHINGINNDNRLENLRMLCPNCNSQQETFCGKNLKIKKYKCIKCKKDINTKRKYCDECYKIDNSVSQRKVKERPSREQLLEEIKESNYCAVGRKYGVSDNAIRKWLK
jgi:transposase-like protein